MLRSSMSTISESTAENQERCHNQRDGVSNENDSCDEASYSSTTSIDSVADSRARSQKARNVTEKRRRDKLNMYINQLAALLPAEGHQRMDKSSVLKQGVDYLKQFNLTSSFDGSVKAKSSFLSADELGDLLLETLNGLILVVNENGLITYAAEHFKAVFGLETAELNGKLIESLVHPDDIAYIRKEISKPAAGNSSGKERAATGFYEQKGQSEAEKYVRFSFRLVVGGTEIKSYKGVSCKGFWKEKKPTELDDSKKQRLLILLVMPANQTYLRELCHSKIPSSFSSRHGMDGKFLFVDTSCTRVTGYLPHELLNTSLYFYVHETDLEEVMKAHSSLTTFVDVGSILVFFQFRSKSDQWLLMKVILRVTYNPMTSKPEYFNANVSLATRNEIQQYKKLKMANEYNRVPNTGCFSSSTASALLASLARDRQNKEQSKITKENEELQCSPNNTLDDLALRSTSKQRLSSSSSFGISAPSLPDEQTSLSSKEDSEKIQMDSDMNLHIQLKKKIDALSTCITRQKAQLQKIHEMMTAVRNRMLKSEGLKMQQEQEQRIFEYISSTILEQEIQCNKLRASLDGKMKISETKRRAMELRGKARAKACSSGKSHTMNNQPSILSDRFMFPCSQVESRSFPATSGVENLIFAGKQIFSGNQAQQPLVGRDRDLDSRNESLRSLLDRRSQDGFESHDEQSLQRQLQQLESQSDSLNAPGMALLAQTSLPKDQLESVQKALIPNIPSASHSSHGQAFDGLMNIHSMNSQLLSKSLTTGDVLPSQALSELQTLQQELQLQMQMLGQQQSNASAEQSAGVSKIIMALQQLQQMQIRLLQGAVPDKGLPSSNKQLNMIGTVTQPPSTMQQLNQTAEVASPTFCMQGLGSSYSSNMALSPTSTLSRPIAAPGESSRMALLSPSPNRESPLLLEGSDVRFSEAYNSSPRSTAASYSSFSQYSTSICTTGVNYTAAVRNDTRSSDQAGHMMFGLDNQGGNSRQSSPDEKGKKLADEDSVYQYLNSLPGQTQQLMQLHQAQRMHIVRRQHQQLQALQHCQLQTPHQQQQQQQQQPHQYSCQQQQLLEEHGLRHQLQQQQQQLQQPPAQHVCEQSTSDQQHAMRLGYSQEQVTAGMSMDSGVSSPVSLGQWQNDLQVNQVGAMSDMDLFELLSGQSGISFTEEDEQVLDLLIAEGNDMFSI